MELDVDWQVGNPGSPRRSPITARRCRSAGSVLTMNMCSSDHPPRSMLITGWMRLESGPSERGRPFLTGGQGRIGAPEKEAGPHSYSFQAEVVQILELMIHSLYSNKEIFLRELISNASDAIDRLRLEKLLQQEQPEADGPLQIVVSFDTEAGTITISDNGIGMSKQEVIDNLGTIARSGTREFIAALTGDQRKDANLIGEFGVGFYSA